MLKIKTLNKMMKYNAKNVAAIKLKVFITAANVTNVYTKWIIIALGQVTVLLITL